MKVGVIGCGVMGGVFARYLAAQKNTLCLYDRHPHKREELATQIQGRAFSELTELLRSVDWVVIAVKPKGLKELASTIDPLLLKGKVVISVLTGVSVSLLRRYFPGSHVVRAMPNLGVMYGEGVTGWVEDPHLSHEIKEQVDCVMRKLGLNLWIPEDKVDALVALSGSGIGFMMVIIEALLDGGISLGFNVAASRQIVLQTLKGAVALLEGSGKHPAELKLQVSSPGGTTVAGLQAMEERGVRFGLLFTLQRCYEKAISITAAMEEKP